MSNQTQLKPGAALVALRWAKTTLEERKALAVKMNDARWGKHRKAKVKRAAAK